MIVLTKLPETGHWAWWLGSHIGHLLSDEKECVTGLITHTHTHIHLPSLLTLAHSDYLPSPQDYKSRDSSYCHSISNTERSSSVPETSVSLRLLLGKADTSSGAAQVRGTK